MSGETHRVAANVGWMHFPHDADVGVRGFGPTPAAAFEQAASALTAVVTHDEVKPLTSVDIRCEAPNGASRNINSSGPL